MSFIIRRGRRAYVLQAILIGQCYHAVRLVLHDSCDIGQLLLIALELIDVVWLL